MNDPTDIDDFADTEERDECYCDFVGLSHALSAEERDMWASLTLFDRCTLWRKAKKYTRDGYYKHGIRNSYALAGYVEERLHGSQRCGSILTVIALAVLSAVIQWLVQRWLDRFKEVA